MSCQSLKSNEIEHNSLAESLLPRHGCESTASANEESSEESTLRQSFSLLLLLWMGSIVGIFTAYVGINWIDRFDFVSTSMDSQSLDSDSISRDFNFCSLFLSFAAALIWSFVAALTSYFVYVVLAITVINLVRQNHQHQNEDFVPDSSTTMRKSEDPSALADQYMFSIGTIVGFTTTCVVQDLILK